MVLEAEIQPEGSAVGAFTDRLAAFLDQGGVDTRAAHHVGVVLDEVLTNLAMHGHGPDQTVTIRIAIETGRVVGTIVDHGQPFDPRSTPDPDVTASLDDRPIGGLGLFLVRKLTDTLDYVSRDGENHTTFSVSRTAAPSGGDRK